MANVPSTNIEQQGSQQEQTQGVSEQARPTEVSVGSPITDEAYDVIAALQSKLEGLDAYRKYAEDGNKQLWHELTEKEIPAVQCLLDELERLVKEGKLRMQPPSEAHH